MEFRKYQHLERFGTDEVEGINIGTCYVFPKIDGTNASVWCENGELKAGSRNRELTLENDNRGFYAWVLQHEGLKNFFKYYPNDILYGEWLVPHTLKTYRDYAWNNFYVFDIIDEYGNYVHFNDYSEILDLENIEYVPLLKIIKNGNEEDFRKCVESNTYLIKDGEGIGEGVVIKNYDFVNKFGRVTWAKIVNNEFKEKHIKAMGSPTLERELIEQLIVDEFVTKALCDKVYAKIKNDSGWNSNKIPQLLNTVFYDLVKEDTWNFTKKHKMPTIDFKILQKLTFIKVKQNLSELF